MKGRDCSGKVLNEDRREKAYERVWVLFFLTENLLERKIYRKTY